MTYGYQVCGESSVLKLIIDVNQSRYTLTRKIDDNNHRS